MTLVRSSTGLKIDLEGFEWPSSEEHQIPWRQRLLRAFRPTEIKLLTVGALILYVASGLWTHFSLHFWINDALNRSDDALYVTIGRDPHLAAIGFYWPPLPQLLELPFMPFLRPFGEEILAGPLMTAICMTATIPVLATLGRRLGVGRWMTFAVCAVFAVTPDMVYSASNGMAEACFVLGGAVTMLGFLTWIDTHATKDLIVFSLGVAMLVMTRLEGPFIGVAVIAIAVFDLKEWRRSLWNALLIGLPAAFCYGFWLLIQWILLGDPLFFLHQNGGGAPAIGQEFWLPPDLYQHPLNALKWVLGWVAVLAPILFVLALLALIQPLGRRTRGSLGILAAIGAVLAIQAYTAISGPAFGNPRYFVMAVPFGAVGALWLASHRRELGYQVWNVGLVGLLVLGACTGSYSLTSGRVTHEEQECSYFQYGVAQVLPFLGRPQTGKYACHRLDPAFLTTWQHADGFIDRHLRPSDRVLADNSANYAAELFTTRPKLFVVRNDRDWDKTIAYPTNIDYILTQSGSATGAPSASLSAQDDGALLISLDKPSWHLVKTFGSNVNVDGKGTFVQLWHFVPAHAGQVPIGTESNI